MSVTYYPLHLVFPWTSHYSPTRWKLLEFQNYLYYPWVIDPLIVYSTNMYYLSRAYINFHLRNYYGYSFHEHTSLGSPKGIHRLNPRDIMVPLLRIPIATSFHQ